MDSSFILLPYSQQSDKAAELHSVRELRDIASLGDLDAQLALCRYYCTSQYSTGKGQYASQDPCGQYSRLQAVQSVRSFIQSSTPSNAHLIFTYHPEITNTMRWDMVFSFDFLFC